MLLHIRDPTRLLEECLWDGYIYLYDNVFVDFDANIYLVSKRMYLLFEKVFVIVCLYPKSFKFIYVVIQECKDYFEWFTIFYGLN